MAKAKHLMLFHYDPGHSDTEIDAQLSLARDLSTGDTFDVSAAAEGRQIEIGHWEE
jgi:hypothetical protein